MEAQGAGLQVVSGASGSVLAVVPGVHSQPARCISLHCLLAFPLACACTLVLAPPVCVLPGRCRHVTPGHQARSPCCARTRRLCPSALAGFPLHEAPQDVLGFVEVQGQGIIGADFPCPMSVLPGKCAYEKLLDAATMCVDALQCTAVVWFFNGERGPTAGGSP